MPPWARRPAKHPSQRLPRRPSSTDADLTFWEENGYVVVHDAVPPENCQAAAQAIYDFLALDPSQPDTWYGRALGQTIWVPLLHHPALWANRNSPRIHGAFAQIWQRSDLWVNVDQAGFNPPERPGWQFPGPHLHWDVSLVQPVPFGVQGILYLTDTAADQGAFTCVPGFHRIDRGLAERPASRRRPASPGSQRLARRSDRRARRRPHHLASGATARRQPESLHPPPSGAISTMRPSQFDAHPAWR